MPDTDVNTDDLIKFFETAIIEFLSAEQSDGVWEIEGRTIRIQAENNNAGGDLTLTDNSSGARFQLAVDLDIWEDDE